MRYYAVIDTNVLVSALLKGGSVPYSIMELVFNGTIIPVLNNRILNEYREVLSRDKFQFDSEIIDGILDNIKTKGFFTDAEPVQIDLPDPKDRVFYEVVIDKRKTDDAYLVTGNIKHFPEKQNKHIVSYFHI